MLGLRTAASKEASDHLRKIKNEKYFGVVNFNNIEMKFIVLFYNRYHVQAIDTALNLLSQWGHIPGEFNKFIEPVLFIISGHKYMAYIDYAEINTAKIMKEHLIDKGVSNQQIISDEESDNYFNFIKNVFVIIQRFVSLSLDDKYNKYYNSDEHFKKYFSVEFDDFLKDMEGGVELNIIDTHKHIDTFKKIDLNFYLENGPMIDLKFHNI